MAMDDGSENIVCPECGEDVCITRDTARGWTHRSRVLPRIVWIAAILGLVGYWVSIGQLNFVRGEKGMNHVPPTANIVPRIHTSLDPTNIVGNTVTYVSTQDLRDAIGGDADALGKVRDKLNEAHTINQTKTYGGNQVETVVFGWQEPYGTFGSYQQYQFGGTLLWLAERIMVQDVRDPDSIGRNMYQGDWREGGWSFFPRLGYTRITHDGAVSRSWHVSLVNLFGVVSVGIVSAWLIVLPGRWFGLSLVCKRWFRLALFLSILVLFVLLSGIRSERKEYTRGNYSQDIAQSQVYSVDELGRAAADESALTVLCQELLDLVPAQETDLLLAQAWTFKPSVGKQWAKPVTDRLHVSIGRQGMLVSYEKRVYQVQDGEDIPARYRPSFWRDIQYSGMMPMLWGPIENQKILGVGIFRLISIGVLFWLIWRVLHWGARMVLVLVQKRRVLRNQCVFCAYPLTQEATQARYPEVGS